MNSAALSGFQFGEADPARFRPGVRTDVGRRYAMAASALVVAAVFVGGWQGWLMAWPAWSLLLVARAYCFGQSNPFHKRYGRLPKWVWLVHGSLLVGLRGWWWLRTRGRTPCSALTDRVWIGRRPTRRDRERLRARGITRVLDLTAECGAPRAVRRTVNYASVPLLDLTVPDVAALAGAVRVIDEAVRGGEGIYVHCALGIGRTALVAAAYLLGTGRAASVDNAIARVRCSRPGCLFPLRAVLLLEQYQGQC